MANLERTPKRQVRPKREDRYKHHPVYGNTVANQRVAFDENGHIGIVAKGNKSDIDGDRIYHEALGGPHGTGARRRQHGRPQRPKRP